MNNKSRHIPNTVIKQLFSKSAGKCNMCKVSNLNMLEMAHIIAFNQGGARGNNKLQGDNSYENLILLCRNCHSVVDKYPEKYPQQELYRIKKDHESYVEANLNNINLRSNDVCFIKELISWGGICNIPSYINNLPNNVDLRCLDFLDVLNFFEQHPAIYPLNDTKLQVYLNEFHERFQELWEWVGGYTIPIGKHYTLPHFSQAEGCPAKIYRIYEGIEYSRNQEIDNEIKNKLPTVLNAHFSLIQYIRDNYPELDFGY